jgi:hypothetical protein
MKYLHRPTPNENLTVRGRYDYCYRDGTVWAQEQWERHELTGGEAQSWRAEWHSTEGTHQMLSHALLSTEGLERLKLRLQRGNTPIPTLSLTTEAAAVVVVQGEHQQIIDLPPLYGVVTPLFSLARLGLPFDLAESDKQLAMTYMLRPQWQMGTWNQRPTKFGYFPVESREVTVKGQVVKGKGWRMEVPGIPTRTLWFDRNGTLLYADIEDSPAYQIVLAEYYVFG